MKRLAIVSGLALLLALPASAATLGMLLKNTLTMTDTQGGVTSIWLSDGGRMSQIDPSGTGAAGRWRSSSCAGRRAASRGSACRSKPAGKSATAGTSKARPGLLVATLAILEGRGAGQNGAEKAE